MVSADNSGGAASLRLSLPEFYPLGSNTLIRKEAAKTTAASTQTFQFFRFVVICFPPIKIENTGKD